MATYVSDSSINKSEAYWLNKEKRKLYKTNIKYKHLIFNILSHFFSFSTTDSYLLYFATTHTSPAQQRTTD